MSAPLAHVAARACVLLVDGDPAVRALLTDAFADEGLSTLTAEDAVQARAILEALSDGDRVVIVLWDLEAARPDGYDAIRALQARLPGTPVLVMHSFPTGDDLARSRRHGVDGVIAKPLELDELLATVASLRAPAAP